MTEILTGKEGLRAALVNPEEWEVQCETGIWMRYETWSLLDLLAIDTRQFRRIKKVREALTTWFDAVVESDGHGSYIDFEHPDFPKGAKVLVTVTELIDGSETEPDWKARCEQAERELALVTSENQRLSEAIGVTSKTIAARKLHGDHLERITEVIELMQEELENA